MISHPLYSDDTLVREVSQAHLKEGRSVFQLWTLHPSEKWHSRKVLEALDVPKGAKVLSLGCGVGGMESHWNYVRRDLQFDLLNFSQAQLDLCICPGFLIHARAEDYEPKVAPDVTLIAYALGHMDARRVLEKALEYTKGPVVVLDVFDATPTFNVVFAYNTPRSFLMYDLGFNELDVGPWQIHPYMSELDLVPTVSQSTPKLWISE